MSKKDIPMNLMYALAFYYQNPRAYLRDFSSYPVATATYRWKHKLEAKKNEKNM